ncbi:MAG: ROK family transcriptional regulator [Chloroflexi bacterium]|nr:ROK family transcriptional regulator [Chloroflexota bacterium]
MAALRSTVRDLKRSNRERLLRQLYFDAPISRLDLSQRLGLSPATVTHAVAEFLQDGLIVESGVEESEGGRPRTLLRINADYGYLIGVDVGETDIQLEIFDLTLRKLELIRHPVGSSAALPEHVVQQISDGIAELIERAGIKPEQLLGIGVGMPGIVDVSSGVSVFAPNWGWRQIPFLDLLAAQVSAPIYLDNGAKAMSQAEQWFGAGQGIEDMAVLLIGTGVGSSIIVDGRLHRGATNSSGEWGHTSIEARGRMCRCGSRGCLEAYIGAPGIIQRLREHAPESPLLRHEQQTAIIADLFHAAQAGDAAAQQVLGETIEYLGIGIANLINLLNPQRILLGGWVGMHFDPPLLARVSEIVAQYTLMQPFRAAQIGVCQLGQEAVCMGAATLALDTFLTSAGQGLRSGAQATLARGAAATTRRTAPAA